MGLICLWREQTLFIHSWQYHILNNTTISCERSTNTGAIVMHTLGTKNWMEKDKILNIKRINGTCNQIFQYRMLLLTVRLISFSFMVCLLQYYMFYFLSDLCTQHLTSRLTLINIFCGDNFHKAIIYIQYLEIQK